MEGDHSCWHSIRKGYGNVDVERDRRCSTYVLPLRNTFAAAPSKRTVWSNTSVVQLCVVSLAEQVVCRSCEQEHGMVATQHQAPCGVHCAFPASRTTAQRRISVTPFESNAIELRHIARRLLGLHQDHHRPLGRRVYWVHELILVSCGSQRKFFDSHREPWQRRAYWARRCLNRRYGDVRCMGRED